MNNTGTPFPRRQRRWSVSVVDGLMGRGFPRWHRLHCPGGFPEARVPLASSAEGRVLRLAQLPPWVHNPPTPKWGKAQGNPDSDLLPLTFMSQFSPSTLGSQPAASGFQAVLLPRGPPGLSTQEARKEVRGWRARESPADVLGRKDAVQSSLRSTLPAACPCQRPHPPCPSSRPVLHDDSAADRMGL